MASPCIQDSSSIHLFMSGANLAAELVPDPVADNHTLIHVGAGVFSTVYRGQASQRATDPTVYSLNDDALHTFLDTSLAVGPNSDPVAWVCEAVVAWDPIGIALFNGAATFAVNEELDITGGTRDERDGLSLGDGDHCGGTTTLSFTVNPGATVTLHWSRSAQRISNLGNSLGFTILPRGYGMHVLRVG